MSWGVVATVDEPAALLIAFAAWHLDQGASEVRLFFDSPDPEAEAALSAIPGVTVTRCDDAWWAALAADGKRPNRTTHRQMLNAAHAYATATVDWLLHADADEFIADGAPVNAALADVDAATHVVRLTTAERVYLPDAPGAHIFEGGFRTKISHFEQFETEVYGNWGRFLALGMTGHVVGKSLVRTGQGLRMGIHFPSRDGKDVRPEKILRGQLRHFDGLTPLHYLAKLAHRMDMPHYQKGRRNPDGVARGRQASFVRRRRGNPGALERFVQGVQGLDAAQIDKLDGLRVLDLTPFDPRPALARIGVAADLTPEGFDAALRDRRATLLASTGIAAGA